MLGRRTCSECDWMKVVDAASLLGTKLWVLTRPKGMRGERGYVIFKTRQAAFLWLAGGAEAAADKRPSGSQYSSGNHGQIHRPNIVRASWSRVLNGLVRLGPLRRAAPRAAGLQSHNVPI